MKKKAILALVILLVIAAGGIVLGVCLNKPATPEEDHAISIPGYTQMLFAENALKYDILLENPRNNRCTFQYILMLAETGEVLYTSPMLRPGQSTRNVTLNRALPAGEYAGILRVETASLNEGAPMNGSDMQLILKVAERH